jgi:ubiquinone/menaquinone biosynthesis C-methylase UbiE
MALFPHLISRGDFIDLYFKVKERGMAFVFQKLKLKALSRTVSKWNSIVPGSDWWIIPEVRHRWNEKCTGNADLEYEEYLVNKYLQGRSGLTMLSVGCGTGSRERKFAKFPQFSSIVGVDVAANQIQKARELANADGFLNIDYNVLDFSEHTLPEQSYDLILFNSSLHHFSNVRWLMHNKVLPLLKSNGLLVILEHVGPNRLQWNKGQLLYCNHLLKNLPARYTLRPDKLSHKRKVYRPGLLRMLLVDPSEAADSESILPAIHDSFSILEEKQVGGNILHLLLKDISHNFLEPDSETKQILEQLFHAEDEFRASTGKADMVFGIYSKK